MESNRPAYFSCVMWDQLFLFFRSHPLICKIVRLMNIILTSRIVLRHESSSSQWVISLSDSFLLPALLMMRYDLRQVLEYTRYTSAPGPLYLLVLGSGTLYPQVLSWLSSHLLNFFVCIIFSVRPFLTILFNIVSLSRLNTNIPYSPARLIFSP